MFWWMYQVVFLAAFGLSLKLPTEFSATYCWSKNGGVHPHPLDCEWYIWCYGVRAILMKCEAGFLFDPVKRMCDDHHNVKCSVRGTTKPMKPTFKTTTTQTDAWNMKRKPKCQRIVCYFPSWAQYSQGPAQFLIGNIAPWLCTHIIYAFAKLQNNILHKTEMNDTFMYKEIMKTKSFNPSLKILIAVGGRKAGSLLFVPIVSTKQLRVNFAKTSIQFLRRYKFDGLDLDWEFPTRKGSPPEDRERYIELIKELRKAFDNEGKGNRLLLTAAVAAVGDNTLGYDVPAMNHYLDFVSLMTYDFHGGWETKTGHHSSFQGDDFSVKSAVSWWLKNGLARSNLVVGLPMYGRSFTLLTFNSSLGAKATMGASGQYTNNPGLLAFYEVCNIIKKYRGSRRTLESQKVPYLLYEKQWVGYDDEKSLSLKVDYVRSEGLGGVMVWDISLDDFSGKFCGHGSYALLSTIYYTCRNE